MEQNKYIKRITLQIIHICNKIRKLNNDKDEFIKLKILYLFCLMTFIGLLPSYLYYWSYSYAFLELMNDNKYKQLENFIKSSYNRFNYWFGINNDYSLMILNDMANFYASQRYYDKAIFFYEKEIEVRKKYNKDKNYLYFGALRMMSFISLKKGDFNKALSYAQQSLAISNKLSNITESLLNLQTLELISIKLKDKKRLDLVINELSELEKKYSTLQNPEYAKSINNYILLKYYIYLKDYENAIKAANLNIKNINLNKFECKNVFNYRSVGELALIHEKQGETIKSQNAYKKRIELSHKLDFLSVLHAEKDFALFLLRIKEFKKSENLFKKVLNKEIKYFGELHPEVMCTYHYLGRASNEKNNYFFKSINIAKSLKKCTNCNIFYIKKQCELRDGEY